MNLVEFRSPVSILKLERKPTNESTENDEIEKLFNQAESILNNSELE